MFNPLCSVMIFCSLDDVQSGYSLYRIKSLVLNVPGSCQPTDGWTGDRPRNSILSGYDIELGKRLPLIAVAGGSRLVGR